MRMLLVVAASVLLACSAGCERTVREARNSTSRQRLRQPSFAPRTARSTVAQTRAPARTATASTMLRMPSLPPQLSGRQSAAVAQGQGVRTPQQKDQRQSKPSLVNSLLSYPKKYLSKLANLI
jgi:hypothetical protein